MINITICFSLNHESEKFTLSNSAFKLLKKTLFNNLPLRSSVDSFSFKPDNIPNPIIGVAQAFLIKGKILNILNNEYNSLDSDDVSQFSSLFDKLEYIFGRSLRNYHEPSIYTGGYTLSVEKLN